MKGKNICLALSLVCLTLLTGCFTGIEGTKKISLTSKDKSELMPTSEEKFLDEVVSQPLQNWNPGKQFFIADDKISVIMEPTNGSPLKAGDIIEYSFTDTGKSPDGSLRTILVFTKEGNNYRLPVAKTPEEALKSVLSGNLPMLIDLDMVEKVKQLMTGKTFWSRTPLWFDAEGNYITGLKYAPLKITDVKPGNSQFPLVVSFLDENQNPAFLPMNFGNSGNESRGFAKLFSLKDKRKDYPGITDENWEAIRAGKVINGMTKDECRLSLGNPSDVNNGHDYSRTLEIWYYPNGTYLQFSDGILVNFRN